MLYVGIDLGTTNSAVCSYDGQSVKLYKSPEQNDVTPSAIFIDKRGTKYLGRRAYDSAARNPSWGATKFKRLMGTGTKINIASTGQVLTPEECSAEILGLCYSYLPEEIRMTGDIGTVITVPASFNLMQKDATLAAADLAGIGKVAVMQEPVAAVMSAMRQQNSTDGAFLVFDMGGGTLDLALAECHKGHVSLIAHDGMEMCGGADFDRAIVDHVLIPWLVDNFQLSKSLLRTEKYNPLLKMCFWAAERSKMELSLIDQTVVSLSELDIGTRDEGGKEIYLDCPLTRSQLNELLMPKLEEAIYCSKRCLNSAGLELNAVGRIVFVGGPTQYAPLRSWISEQLNLTASQELNPMTAVAEGAAIFAESVDWTTNTRKRKSSVGSLKISRGDLEFNYKSRTTDDVARITVNVIAPHLVNLEMQFDSTDSGWTSGRIVLTKETVVRIPLSKFGANKITVSVFNGERGTLLCEANELLITKIVSSVDSVPASHSIGIETLKSMGGTTTLEYLVKAGESLPKAGKKIFQSNQTLNAGSMDSINFKIWEGEIKDPIEDNRFVGTFRIRGTDFDLGPIEVGAELHCDFELNDSGLVNIQVAVPSIGAAFHSNRNFYSRQAAQIDFRNADDNLLQHAQDVDDRLQKLSAIVSDPDLDRARSKIDSAKSNISSDADPETAKQAYDDLQETKRLLASIRNTHKQVIWQTELNDVVKDFDDGIRELARSTEVQSFGNLAAAAQRAIHSGSMEVVGYLEEMRRRIFQILWRQDDFVSHVYSSLISDPELFADRTKYMELVIIGSKALLNNDCDRLREVIADLRQLLPTESQGSDMSAIVNIVSQ